MYYNLFLGQQEERTNYLFDTVSLDNQLRKKIVAVMEERRKPFRPINVLSRLSSANVDSSIKNRLIRIFEAGSNSFLFVDFWGTWCAPCLREMPLYHELIDKLKTENIRFLFLAAFSEASEVTKVKKQFNISADFILLSDNE